MARRRCTRKLRSPSRPTVRCNQRAVAQFNEFDRLCKEHAEEFASTFPSQPAEKYFADKEEAK